MKLILQKDVKNLGKAGDQVSVKNGFARNFLIPKGYALLLNQDRLKTWNHQKRVIEAKKRKAVSERKVLIEKLSSIQLLFERESQKDNKIFGSITAYEISQVLEKKHAINVDKKDIHFSDLKTVGDHKISIRLDSEHQTEILLTIKGKIRKKREEKASSKPTHLETETVSSAVETSPPAETEDTKKTSLSEEQFLAVSQTSAVKEKKTEETTDSQNSPGENKELQPLASVKTTPAETVKAQSKKEESAQVKESAESKSRQKEEKKNDTKKEQSAEAKTQSTDLENFKKEEKETQKTESSKRSEKENRDKKQKNPVAGKKAKVSTKEKLEEESKKPSGLLNRLFGKKK